MTSRKELYEVQDLIEKASDRSAMCQKKMNGLRERKDHFRIEVPCTDKTREDELDATIFYIPTKVFSRVDNPFSSPKSWAESLYRLSDYVFMQYSRWPTHECVKSLCADFAKLTIGEYNRDE